MLNPVVALVAASVMWGCTWWPLKQVAALGVSGLPQILVANTMATLLVLPLLLRQRAYWYRDWRILGAIVLLGGSANVAFSYSLIHGSVVRVMVLFYLLPVWGVLGGMFFLGERIDRQRMMAVALALGGAFLILGGPDILAAPPSWIDLLALASGFLFAMNNLCFRAAQGTPVGSKTGAMFVGSLLLAGLFVGSGVESLPMQAPEHVWLLAAGLGILLVIVTACSQYGVTHLEAGRASVIIIVELLTAVLTASWWAGERMSGIEWFGGALILSAAVLEAWRPKTAAAR